MTRLIGLQTYKIFMKKYKLGIGSKDENGKWKQKHMKTMQKEIFEYETSNNIQDGLYYNKPRSKN